MIKRALDILAASMGLLITLPLLPFIAFGIKLESPGPVIISVPRVGKDGKVFPHYRFRTASGNPPKKTRFGRFLGNRSMDDIAALLNVLSGDLSLVGPRPEWPERVDLNHPDWQKVLSVKPGLTGLGLIVFNKNYNQTPIERRLKVERYYVDNHSLMYDLKIFLKTLNLWLKMGHIKGKI